MGDGGLATAVRLPGQVVIGHPAVAGAVQAVRQLHGDQEGIAAELWLVA